MKPKNFPGRKLRRQAKAGKSVSEFDFKQAYEVRTKKKRERRK